MTRPKPYRSLPHTADIRVRFSGRNLSELFRHGVFALTDTLVEARTVRPRSVRRLRLKAPSLDLLLVRFLQELLFLFDAKGFLARRIVFDELRPEGLKAGLVGEIFDPKRHRPKTEVKAVTYHGLAVTRKEGKWIAEMVFDV